MHLETYTQYPKRFCIRYIFWINITKNIYTHTFTIRKKLYTYIYIFFFILDSYLKRYSEY